MSLPVKVALDGTLFSECELRGANRDGMMRLAEDITTQLILNEELDIFFASNVYIDKYDKALKKFVSNHYSRNNSHIFSKSPPAFTNILKWKELFKRKILTPLVTPYYEELNSMDIFHSFYYPFQQNIKRNKLKRSITFLDIIPLKLPGYPAPLIHRTQKIVDCIRESYAISISEFSKHDLLEYDKKIEDQNIFVVPLAASPDLFYKNDNKDAWIAIKKKYNLPDNYFLSVSGADTRKNIAHLIKSFNEFILQEKYSDLYLVLTGNQTHSHLLLNELNISKEVRNKIVIPSSYIDSKDLAVLYSNAICFFFMSVYEGFGLPALEAMQCGTPVVTSNTTSLPEVVGNAGIMISPTSEEDLCDTMNKIYIDSSLREKYTKEGLERAKTFSWQRCANEYTKIFKKITSTLP